MTKCPQRHDKIIMSNDFTCSYDIIVVYYFLRFNTVVDTEQDDFHLDRKFFPGYPNHGSFDNNSYTRGICS